MTDWKHELRRVPIIELMVVVLGTALAIGVSIWTGLSADLEVLIKAGGPGRSIADIGPGLLFLTGGLGVVSVRRWLDSEHEREHLNAAQASLVESEERYRSLVEVSPDPILVGVDGLIAYANPAAVTFFGAKDVGDLIGLDFLDRVIEDRRQEAHSLIRQVLASGQSIAPMESLLLRLDGTEVDAETSIVFMRYEGRDAIQTVVRDLTARHAADEALARYHALAQNSQEIVFFATPDGIIVDTNRAATLKYGYSKQEFASMTLSDLRAPGAAPPTRAGSTNSPGDTARFDMVHVLKDGSLIELDVTAERVVVGNDELVVSVCRDVTQAHAAERDLRASETRYRSLIESSPVPIAVYDADRTVVFVNQATIDLLRARQASQIVGQNAYRFIHPASEPAARAAREKLDCDGLTPPEDMTLLRLDGTSVAVQVTTNRTTYNGSDAVQVVLQDVSHLKDIADTLRKTTEDTISAMARLAETRDPYTSGHQERVAAMADRIAARLGLPESTREAIRLAGTVHDIGKMNVPAEILSKPGRLTDTEFELIKGHAQKGYEVLLPIDFPWPIADIVRQHHERLDGSGYPLGLRGEDIRIEARVLAVADTVEAISSNRPYRPALGIDHALKAILDGRGTLYDADVVDACVELAGQAALFADAETAAVLVA